MKQETLKKAKDLEKDISEYGDLLLSRNANYHTMLIKISCAYSSDRNEYHGRVSKEVWNKMLDVVAEERQKTKQELEALTDDTTDGMTAGCNVDGYLCLQERKSMATIPRRLQDRRGRPDGKGKGLARILGVRSIQ